MAPLSPTQNGTAPARGNDASHRDRPAWYVGAGGNMFNSLGNLGNLAINPEAALLFLDFTTHTALHLSDTAELQTTAVGAPGDDGGTDRRVEFTAHNVARSRILLRADLLSPR